LERACRATVHCEMAPPTPLYMDLSTRPSIKIQRDYNRGPM
jgi:hypothetical protein